MNTRLLAMTGVTFGVLFTLAFHSLQKENAALESEIETIAGGTVIENELYEELKSSREPSSSISTAPLVDASTQPIEEENEDNARSVPKQIENSSSLSKKRENEIRTEKPTLALSNKSNKPAVTIQRTSFEKTVHPSNKNTPSNTVNHTISPKSSNIPATTQVITKPTTKPQAIASKDIQPILVSTPKKETTEIEIEKLKSQAQENREKLSKQAQAQNLKKNTQVSVNTAKIPVDYVETNETHERLLFPANPMREIFPITFDGNEVFILDNGVDNLITGAEGTLISLPAGSFVNESGIVVEGKVQFHLKEFYKKTQLLTSDLNTKTFNGALHANSMIFTEATQQSQKLQWNPGKQMLVSFSGSIGAETQLIHKTDAQSNWSIYHNEEKNIIALPLHALKFGQEIDAKYEKTIIATREFEKRYNFLKSNAKELKSVLVELYVSNLNMPMHEIDELAAQKLKDMGANYGVIQQFKSYAKENSGYVINAQDNHLKLDAEQTRLYETLQQGILQWRQTHPFTPVANHTFKFNQLGFIGNTSEKTVVGNAKVQITIENEFIQTPFVQVVMNRKNTLIPTPKVGFNQYQLTNLPDSEEAWVIAVVKEKEQIWFAKSKFTTGKEKLIKVSLQPISETELEKALSTL